MPSPWRGRRVVLAQQEGERWTGAEVSGRALEPGESAGEWLAGPALQPGNWNRLRVAEGSVCDARLVASENLHINSLEASLASGRTLSIRARFSREGARNLYFTLTTMDGQQVSDLEITVARPSRDLSVAMTVGHSLHGSYRLKLALMEDERVLDNARIDVEL